MVHSQREYPHRTHRVMFTKAHKHQVFGQADRSVLGQPSQELSCL